MKLVDVHAHLDLGEYDNDMDEMISKCSEAGVKIIIANGVNVESNKKVIEISEKYEIVKPALGVYPSDCLKYSDEEFNDHIDWIKNQKPIAIGEIGLDYKEVEEKDREVVEKRFVMQIELAKELDIPIIVHSRKAEERVIEVIEESGMKKVVMHCFCGKKKLVQRIIDNKWSLSIPAPVVYAQQFQDNVKTAPIQQLLTETDSPWMSPDKTSRNDSSSVKQIVEKIAELKGLDKIDAANMLFMNYQNLFG